MSAPGRIGDLSVSDPKQTPRGGLKPADSGTVADLLAVPLRDARAPYDSSVELRFSLERDLLKPDTPHKRDRDTAFSAGCGHLRPPREIFHARPGAVPASWIDLYIA
jgi:hypothetical protein